MMIFRLPCGVALAQICHGQAKQLLLELLQQVQTLQTQLHPNQPQSKTTREANSLVLSQIQLHRGAPQLALTVEPEDFGMMQHLLRV